MSQVMCGDFTTPSLSLHSQILNLIRGCYVCGEGRFELLFGISKGHFFPPTRLLQR